MDFQRVSVAAAAIGWVTVIVGLAVVDGAIEKLVLGIFGSALVLGAAVVAAAVHVAQARVTAARILAGMPTRPTP